MDGQGTRREALRHFLRSRRARISPGDVGLPEAGRRHTPGLRREEVAVLAGVSASWYTWLEQGRDIQVSDGVLDAVGSALRLDSTERAHLYRLAGKLPPPGVTATAGVTPHLQRVVDGWLPAPAYVVDRYWNTLAANAMARSVLGIDDKEYNYLSAFFTDPLAKSRYPRWDEMAVQLVGQFRVQAARFPDDPSFDRMARRLSSASPRFAELWARHETRGCETSHVEVRCPDHRILSFEHISLGFVERVDLRIMLYTPCSETNANLEFQHLTAKL
ncbi:helix-turn-helix transcriptional regulator [Actinoallomurus sp. NPDC052308]|uniref:helix-turn-helix transcriptional regulator n=1 Tax=Actinoallomurus sp. NPDC052308 TaxID=3155530 RepID=UPI003438E27A